MYYFPELKEVFTTCAIFSNDSCIYTCRPIWLQIEITNFYFSNVVHLQNSSVNTAYFFKKSHLHNKFIGYFEAYFNKGSDLNI